MTQAAIRPHGPSPHNDGVWLHTGKLIVRSDLELQAPTQPSGGSATLVLPDGIVTTPMLAQGAAQQLLGSYLSNPSFTVPQASVWVETPVQVTCTCSGVLTRVDLSLVVGCPTKGQRVYWGLMLDGTFSIVLGGGDAPEANYGFSGSEVYYLTPSAGTHRFSLGLNGPAGTFIGGALAGGINSRLYITEQKR